GRTDDWYCSVAEAVHLVQTTRLIFRRHQENIGARFHKMRTAVIKLEPQPGLTSMPFDDRSQVTLRLFVPASQQNEIQILRKKVVENADDQIEAFLDVNA